MAKTEQDGKEAFDKKAAKRAEKLRKKEEKKRKKEEKKKTGTESGEEEKEGGVGAKIAVALITIVIVALWIGIFSLLIKLDVGGFGSTVLRPVLKDVPYINRILPKAPEAETDFRKRSQ